MRLSVTIAVACLSLTALSTASEVEAAIRKSTNIPAQGLGPALQSLAQQRDFQVVYLSDAVDQLRTSGAVGELTTDEALTRLLSGTGLAYRYLDEKTVTVFPIRTGSNLSSPRERRGAGGEDLLKVGNGNPSPLGRGDQGAPTAGEERQPFWQRFRLAQADTSSRSAEENRKPFSHDSEKNVALLDEVIVTGTTIKGGAVPSLVLSITAEEMKLAGHANLGEAMRALPQNFAGGQNPSVGLGAIGGSSSSANFTGSSSLNLRGLGADATLTLLNGTRLPYDGTIQATDVASIPMAAIDRVEILLDGASAIYGSDAIGGVANIILKRDYQGAEVSARHGVASDGGYEQQQYSAVSGMNWGSGGVVATADYSKNTAVRARQRDYLRTMPNQNVTIYPRSSQKGVLLSGHQDIAAVAELTLDAFYTDRRTADLGQTTSIFDTGRDSIIWGASPAARFALPGQWSLQLQGAFGSNENTNRLRTFNATTGAEIANTSPITIFLNETETASAGAEGPLFPLPGGQAQFSIGAGYRRSIFDQTRILTGVRVVKAMTRAYHGYGEINLPLVSQDQGIPLVSRLALHGALRHEDYESFGSVNTPKAGLLWEVTPGFDLKASWGRSFKAPTLNQQFVASQLILYPASLLPGATPGTAVLAGTGGNSTLEPERARVITAGFVATPDWLPGFSMELGWFDIDYTNRVLQPSPTQIFSPAYAALLTSNPTTAQQNAYFAALGLPPGAVTINISGGPYDPANVSAILDGRFTNASADRVNGVDLIARYSFAGFGGQLSFDGNASWMDGTRQITAVAPEIDSTGAVFFPAKFKSRFGASWSRSGLTLAGNVNHIGGITNTNLASRPNGGSMTTIDVIGDYRLDAGPLGAMGFNLAVINVFNRQPPFLQPNQPFFPPYDSTNYSALGRTMSVTVTKQF